MRRIDLKSIACAALVAALCAARCAALPVAGAYPSRVIGLKAPNAFEREALARINRERVRAGLGELIWDARLSAVAREHSEDMAEHGYFSEHSPRLGSLGYRMHRAGSSAPNAQFFIFKNGSAEDLMRQLSEGSHPAHLGPANRVGLGIVSRGIRGQRYVTMILCETHVTLDPFPTRPINGKAYRLSGLLDAGYEGPRVAITYPDGTTSEREIGLSAKRRFETIIAFDKGKGRYVVELLGTGKLGPTVLALMRCYSGVDYPPPDSGGVKAEPPRDLRKAEREMLALINKARRGAGLAPLTFDGELAAVARGHSRDMVRNRFFGHISPRRGDLTARMKRAGLHAYAFTENLAQNRTVEGAHKGLMDSPGHRKNILDPRASRVGIGIVRDDSRGIMVTQNFARDYITYDVIALENEFLRTLNAERARKGAGPLAVGETLARAARENSDRMKERGKLGYDRARAILREARLPYAVEMVVLRSTDPPTPGYWPKLLERKYRRVGVGVAQSGGRDGRKDLWTTVMFAE